MVPHTYEMDSLQRDGMPYEDEPEKGACWNCDHMADVYIGGKTYHLCVKNRDNGERGDVDEADFGIRDCEDWDDFEA